jgi:hypothetical protein
MSGINVFDTAPSFESLIAGEGLSHVEGPSLMAMPLCLAGLGALSNVGKILEYEHSPWFQRVNQTTGGNVEVVANTTPLLTRQASQGLASTPSALRLQRLAQLGEVTSFSLEPRSEERKPVRGSNHGVMVEINPHCRAAGRWWLNRLLQDDVNIVALALAVVGKRRGLGFSPLEQAFLVATNSQRQMQASLDGSNADAPIFLSKGEDVLIVSDRLRLKVPRLSAPSLSRLDSIRHAADSLTSKIGRQAESFTNLVVNQFVQAVAASYVALKCYVKSVIASTCERFSRLTQSLGLFGTDFQFALHGLNKIHGSHYINRKDASQALELLTNSFPCAGVSLANLR